MQEVKIIDAEGNILVHYRPTEGSPFSFDLQEMKNGVYFLHLITPQGTCVQTLRVNKPVDRF